MKKLIFIFILVSNIYGVFAQSDSVSFNAVKETTKLDVLAQLSENQKKEILKILQDYYKHKEDIDKTKEDITKAKENLRNMLDLVRSEELNFDENLKYILTQHQYERCASYFKNRKARVNKANGIPKQFHKSKPPVNKLLVKPKVVSKQSLKNKTEVMSKKGS